MKMYKVTRIKEDGTSEEYCHFFNNYGAFENAVTLNMQLHNVGNILNTELRSKFANDVYFGRLKPLRTDRAYVNHGTDVYCVMEAR